MNAKPVHDLTRADLEKFAVWRYDLDSEGKPGRDETWVVPVTRLPVDTLSNCVAGSMVTLADGTKVWALLFNVSLSSVAANEDFLSITVFDQESRFDLARYYDVNRAQSGPEQLSHFLHKPTDAIYPISWDISSIARGRKECLSGLIYKEPVRRLTREERMKLIFETMNGK